MRRIKTIFALTVCCLMIISTVPVAPRASGIKTDAQLSLEYKDFEDGGVQISLLLTSASGICGLFATLEYDATSLALMSCGVGQETSGALNFTYRDERGRVIFVLDGDQNSAPVERLASFYFRSTDEDGGGEVRLLPVADRCAFFVNDAGGLQELALDTSNAAVDLNNSAPDSVLPQAQNRLCSVSAKKGCGEFLLEVGGEMFGNKYFAAGFKLFAVDTQSARSETVIVASVINGEKIELSAIIPFGKRICVIITPLSYNGKNIVEGEKQIFLFE